jgi:hypothetical protein
MRRTSLLGRWRRRAGHDAWSRPCRVHGVRRQHHWGRGHRGHRRQEGEEAEIGGHRLERQVRRRRVPAGGRGGHADVRLARVLAPCAGPAGVAQSQGPVLRQAGGRHGPGRFLGGDQGQLRRPTRRESRVRDPVGRGHDHRERHGQHADDLPYGQPAVDGLARAGSRLRRQDLAGGADRGQGRREAQAGDRRARGLGEPLQPGRVAPLQRGAAQLPRRVDGSLRRHVGRHVQGPGRRLATLRLLAHREARAPRRPRDVPRRGRGDGPRRATRTTCDTGGITWKATTG